MVKRVKKTQKVSRAKKVKKVPKAKKIYTFGTEPPIDKNVKFCDQCGAKNRFSARIYKKCQSEFWM